MPRALRSWFGLKEMIIIRKHKTILKRSLAFITAALIFFSCFIFSTSAADEEINVSYTAATSRVWFPESSTVVTTCKTSYFPASREDDNYLYTTITMPDIFYDLRLEEGLASHSWSAMHLDITPTTDLTSYDFSDYDLEITWKVYNNPDEQLSEGITTNEWSNLSNTLGITDSTELLDVGGAVPQLNGICGTELSPYYDAQYYISGDILYNTYTITDTDAITSILDGSFIFGFPFNNLGVSYIELYFEITLVPADNTDDDSGASPDTQLPVIDTLNPSQYNYYVDFNTVGPTYGLYYDYSVLNFYENGTSSKVRDYTNKFVMSSQKPSLFSSTYNAVLGITYADGVTYNDYFEDCYFNTYTVSLDYSLKPHADGAAYLSDMSLNGFRFEIYFDFPSGFDPLSYQLYLDKINSYYYGFEPFSLTIGSITIPYDYFKFDFDSSGYTTMRATLEFDGKNPAHRYFMNMIASSWEGSYSLTFSLPPDAADYPAIFLGITSGGFWRKYSAPSSEGADSTTSVTPDDGISKEDLDSAYNQGYNQGVSDGSDKNYVFGFFNGIFSAMNIFYNTIAGGISIGGISVGAIVSSIVIIVVLAFIIKKVI